MKVKALTSLMVLASLAPPLSAQEQHLRTRNRYLATQRCPHGWREGLRRFRTAKDTWSDPDCYQFTFEQSSFMVPRGQIKVVVKDGAVVSTSDGGYAPTMDDIFQTIFSDCYKYCPEKGAAVCNVTYSADEGYVETLLIDPSASVGDDQFAYNITDFSVCDD